MDQLSYRRHRFPPPIIQHAIWLYLRFTLSYRDVEELLAERGLEVSYETVRRWVLKFGPGFARRLRRSRPRPSDRWHLDEMVVRIAGKRMYLWRAVDHEGEVLDMLVQRRRDKRAALRLIRKLLRKQGFVSRLLTTDKLGSYGSAFRHLRLTCPHEQGYGRTIAPRIPIKWCAAASAKCNGSSQLDPPSASSVSMPPSTTRSICNVTHLPIDAEGLPSRSGGAAAECCRSSMKSACSHLTSACDRYRDKAAPAGLRSGLGLISG
jgi:transposase-like protein